MHRVTTQPRNPSPVVRRFGNPKPPSDGLFPGDFRATLRERWAAIRATQPPKTEQENPAMGFKITAVRRENPSGALVEVPEEVAKDLEETYAYLAQNPKECGLVTFDTSDEVKTFLSQARSWAATRAGGAVDFRKLPSPGLGDKSFRFAIRAPQAAKPAEATEAPATEEAPAVTEAPKATAKAGK